MNKSPLITVKKNNIITEFNLKENESLFSSLVRNGLILSSVCGGRGVCGKCKVKVTNPNTPVSDRDKAFFSEKELSEGWRLSCTLFPKEDMNITLVSDEDSDFDILSAHNMFPDSSSESSISLLIDIGTTTVVLELVSKGEIISATMIVNSQRAYGADVITRIKESTLGHGDVLRECIKTDLKNGIISLCDNAGVPLSSISQCVIACNTTMTHLLMGYDCTSLGSFPFTPQNSDFIKTTLNDLINLPSDSPVTILPPISAFVGGDIVSGLFALDFDSSKEIALLIDLGTNGEIALGNRDKILTTSTAAGPAFEGGNITFGMPSVSGAICSVEITGSRVQIKTIHSRPPIGICGTGAIELVSEMLKSGIIDKTGLLDKEYFSHGFPVAEFPNGEKILFTQKDVRELQLAKSAIRAGVETLISLYGIEKSEISKVYLAGGFGHSLDIKKAVTIGLLPEEFLSRVECAGNTSLAGCMKLLTHPTEGIEHIKSISREINLSLDENFNELYMSQMLFPLEEET